MGETMRQVVTRFIKEEDGLSTAEYAVGTVAAAGLGGVLIKLLTSPEVRDLIWGVLSSAFKSMFG
jgi:Flp pilus assembly pilin Flp